ncbi:nuclease-related domain-containing protein [Streptomyces sp. NPDC002623]
MTAGRSASAQARAIRARARRGVCRRVLALLGWSRTARRADAVAARWEKGAAAEAATARMLEALHRQGWHVRHDRALPGSRANLDHVLISPCGTAVVVLDTKRWHAGKPTWLVRGRVYCDTEDRHGQVEAVARYAARVGRVLQLPAVSVFPLLVVHGSTVAGGELAPHVAVNGWQGPVYVLFADRLVPRLAAAPKGVRDPARAAGVARRVDEVLRPYQ